MKVLYGEGYAHHTGPEPCGVDREVGGEASAGGGVGQPLSRERQVIPGADDVPASEGNTNRREPSAGTVWPGVVLDPGMRSSSLRGNREVSCPSGARMRRRIASGRRGAVADDERAGEVRLRHSSWEADERSRATGRGVGGAKGGGRGEGEPSKHAPGAVLAMRVTGDGAPAATARGPGRRCKSPSLHPRQEPYAGNPHVRMCVQRKLACSAGDRPAGAKVRSPVVWIAGWRETKTLKPIDNVSLGETTSRRAVMEVNVNVASKVRSPEGRAHIWRAKAAWGAEI